MKENGVIACLFLRKTVKSVAVRECLCCHIAVLVILRNIM